MRIRFLLGAATLLILLALIALIHVQWNWIDTIAKLDEEHEHRVLEFASRQFATEFDQDVGTIISGLEHGRPENLFRSARDPRLIGAIYVEHGGDLDQVAPDGSHKTVPWPAVLEAFHTRLGNGQMRMRGVIEPEAPAIVLPMMARRLPEAAPTPLVFPPHPPILVVLLDRGYMTRKVFPDLSRRAGNDLDVAVSDGRRVVFQSNAKWSGQNAEASEPLLRDSGWRVSMRNHRGAVGDIVASMRRRRLLSLSHVMGILVLSLMIFAIIARRAERLRRQQLEFVAGMTHELNTPLAALQAAGQNLADGVVHDDAQVARYGAMVAKESRRLGDLVAQVLDYSGLQSRQQLARAPVSVAGIVAGAIDATRWLAEEKRVDVQTSIAPDLPPVNGNAEALTRAVQNLIANAIRHGVAPIAVTASRTGEKIAITVEDHGPGIAPTDARHLFEPFYRGRNATARGTGLGLTIVSQIAKAHGGSITFDRHRTDGAAFTLTLPVAHG
ncbi:MAG TPA: HAMP domain-containing sensor histidine kinase [Thermoanaerobaculia bacterium]|nr:HAMP domain-containing sensor histidine kinase [Thermoanaerobaculia bacterium]